VKSLLHENVTLAPFTTFGIGGPARYFIEVPDEQHAINALDFAIERNLPIFILGGGSNLLVADRGFPGLVIRIRIEGISWETARGATLVSAGAGVEWDQLVALCVERDLAGVECLSGIPGSVGGTPVQNVGAYGQEVSEVLFSVRAYDRQAGKVVQLSRADCKFTYRSSVFNTTAKDHYVVLNVTYQLRPHERPAIRYPDLQREFEARTTDPKLADVREAVHRVRARKAMLLVQGDPDCRSAGSFFKNPLLSPEQMSQLQMVVPDEHVPQYAADSGMVKTSAAWLIEHAGLPKGYSMGPAGLSTKHTLALVNKGGATAEDLLRLARFVRERVCERFGIHLIPEPVLLGFDQSELL
jgi:UDP-N-acetylmuramate dehydrogenase